MSRRRRRIVVDSDDDDVAIERPKKLIISPPPKAEVVNKTSTTLKRASGFRQRECATNSPEPVTVTTTGRTISVNSDARFDLQTEFIEHVLSWNLGEESDVYENDVKTDDRPTFASVDDYVSMFVTLLYCDMRASLIAGLDENPRYSTSKPKLELQRLPDNNRSASLLLKVYTGCDIINRDVLQLRFNDDHRILGYVVECQSAPGRGMQILVVNVAASRSSDIVWADVSDLSLVRLGTVITNMREFVALRSCAASRLLPFLLNPNEAREHVQLRLPEPAWKQVPPLLMQRLEHSLNADQLQAVKQSAECTSPFCLIQGPPGTGKTTTVLHLLNVLHLSMYQRHYHSVISAALRSLQPSANSSNSTQPSQNVDGVSAPLLSSLFESLSKSHLDEDVPSSLEIMSRPRILVCAPSNAAVDEIVSRVALDRLWDGNSKPYTPDIVRIGRASSIRDGAVKDNISLDVLVDAFFRYSPSQLKERIKNVEHHRQRVAHNLKQIHEYALRVRSTGAPCDLNALAAQITSLAEERYRIGLELERLEMVRDNTKEGAVALLQQSYIDNAQIVFTTLSGTAGRFLAGKSSRCSFNICIIDESAQCVETATLLPLVSFVDIKVVVLVGDPRQLPATVFLTGDKSCVYERSLFQRLQQAGVQAIMLSQQYRMHPEIRKFPSFYFYSNQLIDGPPTLLYDSPYYKNLRFQPYLFFDVVGRERRQRSVSNEAEASFIARQLECLIASYPSVNANMIGVVTPYAAQVSCIRSMLKAVPSLANVEVATIDSFQGREKNIIMMSCVRAGHGQIGFVKDVRRMNVGITRARHAMWIVGHAATLRSSPAWAALIDDAVHRHLLINSESI